jgi:hypothetical protein
VEGAWRLLKRGLRIQSLFHWAPHRICAHMSLTVVAMLLERLERLRRHVANIRDDPWRSGRELRQKGGAPGFQLRPRGSEIWGTNRWQVEDTKMLDTEGAVAVRVTLFHQWPRITRCARAHAQGTTVRR